MATTNSHVRKLLEDTKASELVPTKGGVIVIKSTDSSLEGFKILLSNNILSAPVLDVVANKYTGFLDMRDLVSFVVFVDNDQHSDIPTDIKEILARGTHALKQPNDGITTTYLSRRNVFHPVHKDDSLWKVCEVLATGVKRVPVVDEKGQVTNIISQSSIISFLQKHMQQVGADSTFTKLIKDLNLGTKQVISVKKSTSAIDTFRLMDNKKISGVAVVDENGQFIGNTSASDLKLFIKTLSLEILHEPIMQYLNKIRQDSIDIKSPTISCTPHDTLATVISKIGITKVHKLFVADDSSGYKPYCVVSITDILRFIIQLHK